MKTVLLCAITLLTSISINAREQHLIPALKSIELSYEEFKEFDVKISNKSGKQVDVSVIDPNTGKQVSGFGLGPLGNAVLSVQEGKILRLKNTSLKDINISISFVKPKDKESNSSNKEKINFTLHNSSLKSIPLVIPNVMNPNLSPLSNSGVALPIGQKIYYKKGISKVLLLTVDEGIKNGDKIDIAKLVEALNQK